MTPDTSAKRASQVGLQAVLLDVDGTLVDSTFAHTTCWWQALRLYQHIVPMAQIHRGIGLGADKILDHLLGERDPSDDEAITAAHDSLYSVWHPRLVLLPGAQTLLRRCAKSGLTVVLSTSAGAADITIFRQLLDCDDVIAEVTSSEDAEHSKPDTDILEVALERIGVEPHRAAFVGDTVWDMQAADALGLTQIGVECGGTSAAELLEAGAQEIWRDPADLVSHSNDSVLFTAGP